MKRKPNKAEADYIKTACSFGCIICKDPGIWHHARAFGCAGKKAPHCLGFCLCDWHHTEGGVGVAIHASQLTFERTHGTEGELIQKTILMVMEHERYHRAGRLP